MKSLLLSCLLSLAVAAPAPQDFEVTITTDDAGHSEVEEPALVLVLNAANERPSFGGFGRFPGFGQQFGGFGDFPSRLPSSFGFADSAPEISIDLSDIFAARPAGGQGRVPAIINTLFDALGEHLGVEVEAGVEGEVTLQGGEEPLLGDGEYDHHNTTFDEKVLEDGSVVRVNRTTIKDTDENGNTFFFSSSIHHVTQESDEEEEDEVEMEGDEEETEEVEEEVDAEEEVEMIPNVTNVEEEDEDEQDMPEVATDYEEDAELVPTDIDETENEIESFADELEREAKAEFPGTDAIASVEDIFE